MEHLQTINEAISQLSLKIDSLLAQHQSRSIEVKDLFAALAKAQAEIKTCITRKENPYFKNKYDDLDLVVQTARPALSKNGLSVVQQILTNPDGQSILNTILCHSSGQWMSSQMRIIPPRSDIQSLLSYVAPLKRLAYASLVGVVAADEDDDGEIAMIDSRNMIAKGPSNKYNPKEESFDTITKEQLEELEYELTDYPDLAEEILNGFRVQSLADLPKSKYFVSIKRIREIKALRNGIKQ